MSRQCRILSRKQGHGIFGTRSDVRDLFVPRWSNSRSLPSEFFVGMKLPSLALWCGTAMKRVTIQPIRNNISIHSNVSQSTFPRGCRYITSFYFLASFRISGPFVAEYREEMFGAEDGLAEIGDRPLFAQVHPTLPLPDSLPPSTPFPSLALSFHPTLPLTRLSRPYRLRPPLACVPLARIPPYSWPRFVRDGRYGV